MTDPVVGGYEPAKVALRRAIGLAINVEQEIRLYWRGQAVPAQSGLMPHTMGYDAGLRQRHRTLRPAACQGAARHVRLRRPRRRRLARAARRLAAACWSGHTTPDQRARQRDELRRKDLAALGIKIEFKSAKWPENLKNARAGKLMVWNLGYSAAAPDGQSVARPRRHHPLRRPEPGALLEQALRRDLRTDPRASGRSGTRRAVPGSQAHARCRCSLSMGCAPYPDRPCLAVADWISPTALLEHVLAVHRHRH